MPRTLTKEAEARFMGWAQELDGLVIALGRASLPEKLQAYRRFEKRILKETRTAFERQEMRRRITQTLLREVSDGPWRRFSPYLRRMERLGYSSMDCRLLVCTWSARAAKDSPAGVRTTAALIADFERRARGQKLHPAVREQTNRMLARARGLVGLDTAQEDDRRKQVKPLKHPQSRPG